MSRCRIRTGAIKKLYNSDRIFRTWFRIWRRIHGLQQPRPKGLHLQLRTVQKSCKSQFRVSYFPGNDSKNFTKASLIQYRRSVATLSLPSLAYNLRASLGPGNTKGEVSLYDWPPVWLVWNQLYDNWQFLFLFAKQINPNQSNRRSMVQWYFPLYYSLLGHTPVEPLKGLY